MSTYGVLEIDGVRLAYSLREGRAPTVVFLPGFRSDMRGTKALYLDDVCRQLGHAFLRFDYQGHGCSSGRFEDGTIGRWSEDARLVIEHATTGSLVLVGSSMGGWIMVRVALALGQRVHAMLGVASAPDFTDRLMAGRLSDEAKQSLHRDGRVTIPSAYSDEPTIITRALIDDGEKRRVLQSPIPFFGPVRLLHGLADADVPWSESVALMQQLESNDVRLELIKDGDHRLSAPRHLARIGELLSTLLSSK